MIPGGHTLGSKAIEKLETSPVRSDAKEASEKVVVTPEVCKVSVEEVEEEKEEDATESMKKLETIPEDPEKT